MTMDDWLVLLLVVCVGWLCFAGSAAALHWYLRVMYPPTRIVVVKGERNAEAMEEGAARGQTDLGATDPLEQGGQFPRPAAGEAYHGFLAPFGVGQLPPDQC